MYRYDRRRETSGGTVFGLYFGTARLQVKGFEESCLLLTTPTLPSHGSALAKGA
jgi:hypothetical protein